MPQFKPDHFVSLSCQGEKCSMCGEDATHKVSEEKSWDDPFLGCHGYTAYVCCKCFQHIMGPAVACKGQWVPIRE